jgi:hypothetical protein
MEECLIVNENDISMLKFFQHFLNNTGFTCILDHEGTELGYISSLMITLFQNFQFVDGNIVIDATIAPILMGLSNGFATGTYTISKKDTILLFKMIDQLVPVEIVTNFLVEKVVKIASWNLVTSMIKENYHSDTGTYNMLVHKVGMVCSLDELFLTSLPDCFLNSAQGRSIFCKLLVFKKDEETKLIKIVSEINRLIIEKFVSLKGVYDLLATINWFEVRRSVGRVNLAILKGLYSDFVEPVASKNMKYEKILGDVHDNQQKNMVPDKREMMDGDGKLNSEYRLDNLSGFKRIFLGISTTDKNPSIVKFKINKVVKRSLGKEETALKIEPSDFTNQIFNTGSINFTLLAKGKNSEWAPLYTNRIFTFLKNKKGHIKPMLLNITRSPQSPRYKLVVNQFSWSVKSLVNRKTQKMKILYESSPILEEE